MSYKDNADKYAKKHTGKFFWGRDNRGRHLKSLDGQCVSMVKRYIGTMAKVKDWYKARGNAKDFGDNLVRDGLAKRVSSPKRGDLAVWKKDGAGFGHVGVVLSGHRVFEGNVGIVGTKSKVIAGVGRVYATRIDPLNVSWRVGEPTFYRLKGYKEKTATKKKYYKVKYGDTMSGIALRHKTTLAKLDKLNPKIKNLNKINVGLKVRVK